MHILNQVVVLALLALPLSLHGKSLEEAADTLGDEQFERREQAELVLKNGGAKALAIVEPLLASEDPEVATRARRVHDWIVGGLDERIPDELAADLRRFDKLAPQRRNEVIAELSALDPPHFVALAHLHSRLFTMPVHELARADLVPRVEAQLRRFTTGPDLPLETFASSVLGPRTRAFLINWAAAARPGGDLQETYAAWQELQPALRGHLNPTGVRLELKRLRATWDKRDALAFLSEIEDEQAFKLAAKDLRDWMLGDPTLVPEELEEAQAVGYLELSFGSKSPGRALALYKKLRERIPELRKKLRPSRQAPLQAMELWELEDYHQAIALLVGDDPLIPSGTKLLAQFILENNGKDYLEVLDPIPVESRTLETLVGHLLADPVTHRGIDHALAISACLRKRSEHRFSAPITCKEARHLSLDLWLAGQDDLCYRLMEEAFWSAHVSENWRLSHFPALAATMGRLDEALATADSFPAETEFRDLKLASLHRADDDLAQALVHSSRSPKRPLHPLLLMETRNWAALAEANDGSRFHEDWFACLNGDREPWRQILPEPEKKASYLRLLLDDHAGLFGDALNKTGAGVSQAAYARELAGDLLLSELLRKQFEEALGNHQPVAWGRMDIYFDYPDRIPDREEAVQLALRLAGQTGEASKGRYPAGIWEEPTGADFKARTFEALISLGRADLAKEFAAEAFAQDFDLAALNARARFSILRSTLGSSAFMSGVLLKLAQFEEPLAPTLDRLFYLQGILRRPDRAEPVRALLALAGRHEARLSDEDVASLVNGCARMLGRPGASDENPPRPKAETLAEFARSLDHPPPPDKEPAPPARPKPHILRPEIGNNADPKTDDFAVLDGLARARDLWNNDDPNASRDLMRDILMRLILDEKFGDKPTDTSVRGDGRTRSNSGYPLDLAMLGFLNMDIPAELALPTTRIISLLRLEPSKTYITKNMHASRARVFALHGDYDRACRAYHRYCALGLETKFHYRHIEETAYLVDLEIRRALAHGSNGKALELYRRHHRLVPYRDKLADDLLEKLRATGDIEAVLELDRIVTGFWKEKLRGLPDAERYKRALARWNTSFGR